MSSEQLQTTVDAQTGKTVVYSPAESGERMYVTSDTGERPPFKRFISDSAYAEAQSRTVMKTCDVLVYDPGTARVLVATRANEPHRGDWVVGGLQQAGESDKQSVLANIERELGKRVAAFAQNDHLQRINQPYNLIWDSREQASSLNEENESVTGVHHSPTIFGLAIAEDEFNAWANPNEEFVGMRWEYGFDIIEAPDGQYHPAFQDMVFATLEQITRP